MTIGIVGCGNLGEAIVRGLVESGSDPRSIRVSHPRAERRRELETRHGVQAFASNVEVLRASDVTLLGVKPQVLPSVLPELADAAAGKLVVSLAAGTPHETIATALPAARVVRAMPNTPVSVRAGVTGLFAPPEVGESDRAAVTRVFEAVGVVHWVAREELFHALTALSACGPAFVFVVAEAMADGGVAAGLPRAAAATLAAHTIAGAGRMLTAGEHPARLKDQVASPGGTTIVGLAALEKAGVRGGLIEAVRAAARRSLEMAGSSAASPRGEARTAEPRSRRGVGGAAPKDKRKAK